MTATHGSTVSASSRPRFPAFGWWLRDRHGDVVVLAAPNPALAVWLTCTALAWTGVLHDGRTETITHVGQGALTAWALDELLRGASPVRRLLGAVILPAVVLRMFL